MKIWHILRKSLPKLWERITAIPLVPVLPEGLASPSSPTWGATLTPGIELILNAVGLKQELSDADVVVTGEGRLDFQTAMGKAPVGVAKLAKKHHAKVIAFAGSVTKEATACNKEGIDAFFPILRGVCTLAEAMDPVAARNNMTATVEQVFRLL